MATESVRRRSPGAEASLVYSSDLELAPSGEVGVGIDGACGPSLASSGSSPRTSVPASDGIAEVEKLEVGIGVPSGSPSAAFGDGSVTRTTRASVSSSSLTAEDGEPWEANGSLPPAKRKKKKNKIADASEVPESPEDCSVSSKRKNLGGGRRALFFVGDPVPEEEARRRWPYRFDEKNARCNARASAHNVDDDNDELILDVESHYLQANVCGCVFDIGDCAYVKAEKGKLNYIGRILEFFKTTQDEYYFRVQWFFRAQDTVMKEQAKFHDKKRLFYSDLKNDNLLDCIISKVHVTQLPPSSFQVNLKSSITSSCEYYYDMKYSVDYSTFSVINARNEESLKQGHKSHVSQNKELVLLDLYSGCGGMSSGLCLGAHIAGVTLVAKWAIDCSKAACRSFKLNHPETQVRNETADDFFSLLKEWKKLCKMYMVNNVKRENSRHHEESERECTPKHSDTPSGEYEVLKLVDICYGDPTKVGKRGLKFKVRWKGYSPSEDTWEPISNLRNCQDRIREFVIEWSKSKLLPLPGDVDVICGGPPCQGISGYNRFRNFEAPLEDERNRQIVVFMDIVEFLKPKYVLMENVVDILKFAKATLGRYSISRLVSNNYQARLGMMAAGCYGLPQFRLRTFIWGCHLSEKLPQFPLPTHDTILKGGAPVEFERNLVGYDEGQPRELENATVLEDALSDLPPVKNLEVHEEMDYGKSPQTEFQRYIRASKCEMLGITTDDTRGPNTLLYDHYSLPLSEDDYLRVCQIPHRKGANFRDLPGVIIASNNTVHLDPKTDPVLLPSGRQLVPNYAVSYWDGKSLRPFSRLWWDEVVATVLTVPDCHCQTILHPEQDRVLTIRECARLQGFPDYYRFVGTIKERYQQIGNAVAVSVSRVLGYALAMAWLGKGGDEPLMTLPSNFSLSHDFHYLDRSFPEVTSVDSHLS